MSHLAAEPPPFFHRGPSPLARLVFFGVLSLALLFLDSRYRYLENVRQVVAVALYPLQRAARVPGELLEAAGAYLVAKRALEEDNDRLRRELAERGAVAQGAVALQQENARLKALLDIQARFEGNAIGVAVLYAGRDVFTQKLFVDKGHDAGVKLGAAVVDADGVVGQVTRVYPLMAEVTLLTDKDQVIPVKVERSGVRSVMYGAGAGRAPELRFMSPSADVKVGDRVVTSGLDGTYPPGLAVARIVTLDRDAGQVFARITLEPVAGFDRSEQLLVLAQSANLPARPEEPEEAEAAKKGGRARLRRTP